MGDAKAIQVRPISSQDANRIVRAIHYSGKVAQNSQLHFGVFLGDRCGGAMQFGPSIDKRRMQGLVRDTMWNGFIELNRMAFADWLPRNSESRALGVALRMMRKAYPWIEWVVSFADATQCGDGTIYRAAGFVLTAIKKNSELLRMTDGSVVASKTLSNKPGAGGRAAPGVAREAGAYYLPGFQLRYLYFLNPDARARLTCEVLPFSEIERRGAGMYKGEARTRPLVAEQPVPPSAGRFDSDPDAPPPAAD